MSNIDKQNLDQLEYYQNNVEDYEKKGILQRTTNRAFKRKADIISEMVGTLPRNNVLEVGAGSGLLTYFSFDTLKAKNYIAQDLSSTMIEMAKKRIQKQGLEFRVGDVTKMTFTNNTFDTVIGTDIIHHLEDPVACLKEWLRIIQPQGKLCILESNAYNPLNLRNIGLEHEVRSFLNTNHNLKKWMEMAGWKNVKILPAPSFTPAGPSFLVPLFYIIDTVSPMIPVWRNLTALWIVSGEK